MDIQEIVLENNILCLKPIGVDDITDEYINGLNDPQINRYLVNVRGCVQTRKTVTDYVKSNFEDPSSILFGIFIEDDPISFVGTVRISGISFFHFFADIGVCLFVKEAWKKGYGVESVSLVKDYAFNVLGLHYIEAGAYAENRNSINLFKRAGFSERYRIKNKYRHEHSFKETVFLGIANENFDFSSLKQ